METSTNDIRSHYDLRSLTKRRPSQEALSSYTIDPLALSSMQIDRTYQRELNSARVTRIVDSYSPALMLPIVVNVRASGETFIVDGQHRQAALIQLGRFDAQVACIVHRSMTLEEEAWLFDHLNKLQQKLTPLQQYRGGIAAGDQVALDIKAVVEIAGFVIRPEQRDLSRNNIPGIAALKKVRKQHGIDHLRKALGLIAATWGTDHGPSADLIVNVGEFVYLYEGSFSVKRFVRAFGRVKPEAMKEEAKVMKVRGGLKLETAWNFKIIEHYNKGLKDENKLPNEIEMRAMIAAKKAQARHAG